MICALHPSLGEQEVCEACGDNRPPDLGVLASDEIEIAEHLE